MVHRARKVNQCSWVAQGPLRSSCWSPWLAATNARTTGNQTSYSQLATFDGKMVQSSLKNLTTNCHQSREKSVQKESLPDFANSEVVPPQAGSRKRHGCHRLRAADRDEKISSSESEPAFRHPWAPQWTARTWTALAPCCSDSCHRSASSGEPLDWSQTTHVRPLQELSWVVRGRKPLLRQHAREPQSNPCAASVSARNPGLRWH